MRILIGRPQAFIDLGKEENHTTLTDVEYFYDMLPTLLAEMQLDHKVLYINTCKPRIYNEPNSIYLSYHTHGTLDDIWHIKSSYLQDYLYFDKNGYSGWSTLTSKYDYNIDVDTIRDETNAFIQEYITNNKSRWEQPTEAFLPPQPYVLVLGQVETDTVMKLVYMNMNVFAQKIADLYRDTKYTVCVKTHPFNQRYFNIRGAVEATGSIHKLIAGATAVYTINSGGGFEALMHGKRVFTAGKCDYHWATDVIKTDEDLAASINLIEQPVDQDRIIKFIHYCRSKYFINIHDKETIKHRIRETVNAYRR